MQDTLSKSTEKLESVKRFNLAISRAKKFIWVIGNLESIQRSDCAQIKAFVNHCLNMQDPKVSLSAF